MDNLLASIQAKKEQFDRLRPLSSDALAHLQKYYDVELTYTSNAIEGNMLTHRETARSHRAWHHRRRQIATRTSGSCRSL